MGAFHNSIPNRSFPGNRTSMRSSVARHSHGLFAAAAALFFASSLCGQAERPDVYASIDRNAITYAGPERDSTNDIKGPEIRIGMLVPLQGPRKAEGEALLKAARMAVDDEAAIPFPENRRLALVVRDESGPWGRASAEIVRMVTEDRAVALLTSTHGGAAHLAEQVGNRLGVPVVTLSSDATTTQINIPWLFRIPPSDTKQAEAFAEDIYRRRRLHKVLLVIEENHDGRMGGTAFEKAVRKLGQPDPTRLRVDVSSPDFEPYLDAVRREEPQALVFWTSSQIASRILDGLDNRLVTVYLCGKAAQVPPIRLHPETANTSAWVAVAQRNETNAQRENFEQRYKEDTDTLASFSALAAYDAVRLIAAALRKSGPNRARLRDSLAQVHNFSGMSGTVAFDGAGNNQTAVVLTRLH